MARVAQQKWVGAEDDYTKAIERGLDDAGVYFSRGLVRAQREKWAGAEDDLSKAIERGRDDARCTSRGA